ncbi:hypothetical protein ACIQGO_34775 [Streptomyces shenzhenensis]|uniref:hypothetical protein n=1 Tax=Streptomyces shenzhenensis TaxID=943815 RepID=UPI00382D8D01
MKPANRHRSRELTYNDRVFVVRYRRHGGARETGEFTSSDRWQAYRHARQHAASGRLIAFTRHVGSGRREDLTAEVMGEADPS